MRFEQGSLRIARLFGIDVFVHWSWLLIATVELQLRTRQYHSQIWNIAEYLTLFLIVLLHEFGHALACRSVGGEASRIMLWPLGGIAYVRPPARPGAVLWSIAAGPLVNVVLLPITVGAAVLANSGPWRSDASIYFLSIAVINGGLLAYNLLPVYPLDGGQILQSILWFFVGRARALRIAAWVGLVGAGGLVVAAAALGSVWLGILAVFGATRAWSGLKQARAMTTFEQAPRRAEVACPRCRAAPPTGPFWKCGCGLPVDSFAGDRCPQCGRTFDVIACPACQKVTPRGLWPVATSAASADHPPAA